MNVDPITGEVVDGPTLDIVPLNLAALDENALAQMFPSPVQITGALIMARAKNANAPAALNQYRGALRTAERRLKITTALKVKDLRSEFPKATLTELRDFAHAETAVKDAIEARDDAWLAMEYARDYADAIREDIEILRSLNANLRAERAS